MVFSLFRLVARLIGAVAGKTPRLGSFFPDLRKKL